MPTPMHPDTPRPLPQYRQAAERLHTFLRSESLPPGARLPSERHLARQFQFNLATFNKGVASLVAQGHLERRGRRLFLPSSPPHPSCDPPAVRTLALVTNDPSYLPGARDSARLLGAAFDPHLVYFPADQLDALRRLIDSRTPTVLFPLYGWLDRSLVTLLREAAERRCTVVVVDAECTAAHHAGSNRAAAAAHAVEHLSQLSHREIALLIEDPATSGEQRCEAGYRTQCRVLDLPASADRVLRVPRYKATAAALLHDTLQDHPRITALLLPNATLAGDILQAAAQRDIPIPERLSLVGLAPHPFADHLQPSLTTVAADPFHLAAEAATLAARLAWGTWVDPRERQLRVEIGPQLDARSSSARPHARPKPRPASAQGSLAPSQTPPFSHAQNAPADAWHPLDLAPVANRTTYEAKTGWFGDLPLHPLPTRSATWAGVPLQFLPPTGPNALVLRSLTLAKTRGVRLKSRVSLPLDCRASALYILHTAGWVAETGPIADYTLAYDDGSTLTLPIVPYVPVAASDATRQTAIATAHIGDWWPMMPSFHNAHVRRIALPHPSDPQRLPHHLYLLEWQLPPDHPPLRHLTLQSRPRFRTTLAILALTLRL